MDIGKTKGVLFILIKEHVLENHGKDGWKKLLNQVSPKDSRVVDSGFLKNEWYPAPLLNRFLESYDRIFGNGDLSSIKPVASYIATEDLAPLFEVFTNLKNPSFVLSNSPSLWRRYFDTGEMRIEIRDDDKRFYRAHLIELADEDRVSGRAVCTYGIPAWTETALIMAGAQSVNIIHPECRYRGSGICVYEYRWD